MTQAHGNSQVQQIASTFGVTWSLLGAQVVSFAIVCALLYFFAYQPILQMLDERRKQIAQGLANAAEINARLANIESQRQSVIAEARTQAAGILAGARTAAKQLEEDQKQVATANAARIVQRAHEAAELDRVRMMAEARQEVGRLVVQTSAAVIGSVLTAADQRRLAEEAARRLAGADQSRLGAA
jgi:F-type H+-transporting ATPase subunit b